VVEDDRAREVAERLAELSRRRERGLLTDWEYQEASRLVLEGTDEAFPGPESGIYVSSAHGRSRRRARARLGLVALVAVIGGVAAGIWFFVLRDDGGGTAEAVTATTAAGTDAQDTSIPPTTSVASGGVPVTTTTTTLPSELLEVEETVTAHRSTASGLRADAEEANALWEDRTASFAETHEVFMRISSEARALVEEAAAFSAPVGFVRDYQLTVTVLEEFAGAAGGLVTGLEASDDGTMRRRALEALVTADLAHGAAVTALLTLLGVEEAPTPAL
jgi:hypothetical protein